MPLPSSTETSTIGALMRNFLRLLVAALVIVGIYYAVRGVQSRFGVLQDDSDLAIVVHLANCTATEVKVAAADSSPFAIPAFESRDVDNAFWGQGHVIRGNPLDYPAPPIPAELRHDGRAILYLQIDDQLRLHLANGAGCSAARLSPEPKGFPVEPRG